MSVIGLLIPIVVMTGSDRFAFRSHILQETPTFKVLRNVELLSDAKIAEFEFLFALLILAQIVFSLFFFRKTVREFSKGSPPPVELRASWRRLMVGLLAAGIIAISLPLVWGFAAESFGYLSSKFSFLTLAVLSLGPSFLIEGLLAGSFLVFSSCVYWREVP
ncbi:hypothetical protein [Afipia clevelandensis]|uniref:hypothetical protein n=1 Tax=Afipia clevelandensis TaxID=1034 RepID=UPI0012F6CFCA|nr:hypothetical protein [Afipia clevelandensis]